MSKKSKIKGAIEAKKRVDSWGYPRSKNSCHECGTKLNHNTKYCNDCRTLDYMHELKEREYQFKH